MKRVASLIFVVSISVVGCTKKASTEKTSGEAPVSPASLEERGKEVYMKTCIACHNPDPTRDVGIGPAVAGSSRDLLEARILRASYPAGYSPKRTTRTMPQMPHLKDDIEALAAYLGKK